MKKRTLLPLTLGILASPAFSQEVITTTTPEIAVQTGKPPLEAVLQIATEPTPQDKMINVLAEPLDIERFDSTPDANTQKITDYQVLSLPNGFSPDGISIAKDGTIYVASIISGKIVKGTTDDSQISDYLVDSERKGGSWGMDLTENDKYLWVAGGLAGTARSYDAQTGELVANVTLTNFGVVNDLIVTEKAVYLTNSSFPILYKIPLNAEGKQSGEASVIKLSGEFDYSPKYFANANGIDYDRDTNRLIVNHSQLGKYYSINPETGEAKEIDLQGETSSNDGIAIDGSVLVGVEPPKNQVDIFQLSNDHKQATLSQRLTADVLDFPTLVAYDDNYWYIVNGKLSTKATPDMAYEIVKIAR